MAVTQAGGTSFRDNPVHFYGKSNDAKPLENVANGSTFKELDGEFQLWRFDAEAKQWSVDPNGGGGDDPGDIASDEDIEGVIDDIWPEEPNG